MIAKQRLTQKQSTDETSPKPRVCEPSRSAVITPRSREAAERKQQQDSSQTQKNQLPGSRTLLQAPTQRSTLRGTLGGLRHRHPLRSWSPVFSTCLSALNLTRIGSLVKGLMLTYFVFWCVARTDPVGGQLTRVTASEALQEFVDMWRKP